MCTTRANCRPVYIVKHVQQKFCVDANWNKKPWADIDSIAIDQWMRIEKPLFIPQTYAKIVYNNKSLFIIFHVQDCYVKAEKTTFQDMVSRESCVELFFCPNDDPSYGFFNLEFNCGGTFLFWHQKALQTGITPVDWKHASEIKVSSTLPKVVSPEIATPIQWTLEIELPFEILTHYSKVDLPRKSVRWLANLTKTAQGETSNTHYFTWSKIPPDAPLQMFGQPQYFGILVFD